MRSPRGPLNPVALLVVAALTVPEVLRHCKPLAKSIGDFLVKTGEEVRKMAGTDDDSQTPNDVVSETVAEATEEEEKHEEPAVEVADSTEEVALDTVAPTGHHEVESEIAAEAKGDTEAPMPAAKKPRTVKKPVETPPAKNPKRTRAPKPA